MQFDFTLPRRLHGTGPEKPSPRMRRALSAVGALVLTALLSGGAYANCSDRPLGPIDPNPNVGWTVKDSISACPAGDSVITGAHFPLNHPSKLRVLVFYQDSNCNSPRRSAAGVAAHQLVHPVRKCCHQ